MAEIKAEITTEKNTKEAAIDSENMKTKAEMTSESAITETIFIHTELSKGYGTIEFLILSF